MSEVFRKFKFNGSSTRDDGLEFHGSSNDHNGIIKGSLSFLDKLFGSSSENDGGGFTLGTSSEHVKSFSSKLNFFKFSALS